MCDLLCWLLSQYNVLILKSFIHLFEREEERERNLLFAPQMAAVAQALARLHNLCTGGGAQPPGGCFLLFPGHQLGVGSEVEQPRVELAPI